MAVSPSTIEHAELNRLFQEYPALEQVLTEHLRHLRDGLIESHAALVRIESRLGVVEPRRPALRVVDGEENDQ